MRKKVKIAVLGACCSRDMFNSSFVENWKDNFDIVLYRFQPSFISLMSTPIPYPRWVSHNDKQDFFVNMLIDECRKDCLSQLCSVQPEVILIDFYSDVVNGVIDINGFSYITNRERINWKNEPMFQMLGKGRRLSVSTDKSEYMKLWKNAVVKFFGFLEQFLPNTKVFINPIKGTNEIMDKMTGDISLYSFEEELLKCINKSWNEMDEYAQKFPNCLLLKLPPQKYYIDANYKFGGEWIVHFHKEFYKDLYDSLYKACQSIDSEYSLKPIPCNLILNSNFDMGTLFWRCWNENFAISESIFGERDLLFENFNEENKYHQLWCSEIETDGMENTYKVIFECSVPFVDVFEHKTILEIRTFEKRNLIARADSKQEFCIQLEKEKHTSNKFVQYVYEFSTREKYISVGPYVYSRGIIRYRNIQLIKIIEENEQTEILKNPVEECLIRSEDNLIDVNYYQISNRKQFYDR